MKACLLALILMTCASGLLICFIANDASFTKGNATIFLITQKYLSANPWVLSPFNVFSVAIFLSGECFKILIHYKLPLF